MTAGADESELPFRQLAQHLPMLCWISDADGQIVWVNDAWLAYTGLPPEKLAGDGLLALHDPQLLPEVRERWAAAKAAGRADEMVFPLRGRDGVLRRFVTRVVPLRDESGKITRWFGTNSDLSGQDAAEDRARRSEAELVENEYRLRLATESAGVGVWEWRLSTNAMIYSPMAKTICGFDPDQDVTYEMVAAVTHPDDFPETSTQAMRALDPEIRDRSPYRYRIVRPGGDVRWVVASGEAVFEPGPDGLVATRYVGTLIDITDQHETREQLLQSEARLRDSEEQLRLATEAAEIGLWDVDPLSDSLYWPARVKAMFGIGPDAAVSMAADFFPCLHPEDADRVAEAYVAATDPARRALYDVEYRTIGKEDGVLRWVAAKGRGIFNASGQCIRVIGTAVDITARKRAEEAALRQARVLQVLNATGAALAGELDFETIVQLVTDAGVNTTAAEFGAFFYNVPSADGDSYTLYALSGVERAAFDKFPMPRATKIFGPTFRGEGVVRSADITADPRYGQNAPYKGMPEGHLPVRSYLAVSVLSRTGETIGGLIFGHSQPGMFSDEAEEVVAGIAGQASVAVDNARLYQAAHLEIERRRQGEARQMLLINELNHRVKNTLATVQSIVAQTSRSGRSSQEVREAIEGRLLTLSAAHNLLTQHSWEGADLRLVAERALEAFIVPGEPQISRSGPEVTLEPQQALAISMALHELATNAVKYGALSVPKGRVRVSWGVQNGRLALTWEETKGPVVAPPSNRGFGSRLLERGLASELGGQVELAFRPEGVCCRIDAPLRRGFVEQRVSMAD